MCLILNNFINFSKIWNDFQYFKRRGIPGPKPPSFILGHTYFLRKNKVFYYIFFLIFQNILIINHTKYILKESFEENGRTN